MRCAARRRFSTMTMRSVIATAHNSPIVSGCTRWYALTMRRNRSGSKRLSVCATNAQAMPKTRGIARKRSGSELRQFAIETRWQVCPDLANLFLDQVIVVQKPFGRW